MNVEMLSRDQFAFTAAFHSLYPGSKCSPVRAIDIVEIYGAERLWMNSACDSQTTIHGITFVNHELPHAAKVFGKDAIRYGNSDLDHFADLFCVLVRLTHVVMSARP